MVVVAAGRGARFGGEVPKQFRDLGGSPLLLRAVTPFAAHPAVVEVVVVLPSEQAGAPPAWLTAPGDRFRVVAGGADRMDSVEAGLSALTREADIVLVHDGARPFPNPSVIDAIIIEARCGHGAVAAIPVTDTLKETDDGPPGRPRVARTLSRARLWRAQTPQGFPRAMLEEAFRAARADGFAGTDEASLVERGQGSVVIVPDVETNLKVTTPDDFRLAEALLRGPR